MSLRPANGDSELARSRQTPLLARDFSDDPYWWRLARPRHIPKSEMQAAYDVVIIGAGYTGLRAALELSRAGAAVLVCERAEAGTGAARRNAGYLGRTLKKSFPGLARASGKEYARRVYQELNDAYQTTWEFIRAERIECFAARKGRFIAATSPAHLNQLESDYEALHRALGFPYSVVRKSTLTEEMRSPIYHGGIVIPDLGSLHPALYHEGLLKAALAAGTTVATGTEVLSFDRDRGGAFQVSTAGKTIKATHVVVATNGYTPRHLRWFAHRVIPFKGYMAATEELDPKLLSALIPHDRTIVDSNINVDFFRTAPDSPRLLFGGCAGSSLRTTQAIVDKLSALLVRIFPQLRGTRLSAAWCGQCAGTFDMMPHMGCRNGAWYGLGYNFAGVPMGSYFGLRIAQEIIGGVTERSVFAQAPLKSLPLYGGSPWFVPMVMRYFAWRDRRS
jgi:glycine/D-amino acid oxidase-like deaminating enzyme